MRLRCAGRQDLLALGLAVAVSALIEAARRAWRWHANARHRTRRAPPAGQQWQAGLQAAWEDPPAADGLSPVGAGPMTTHGDHDAESP